MPAEIKEEQDRE